MKRIVSLVLCMALALGAVTYRPPQAKAVVFDGAVLGSLYGSVMGSMGLTYAAGGMNNQSFGLAIWDLMTSWYTDMTPEGESALDFFGNLASAGIQAMAPGQVLLNQSLIESISQFAHWLYDKYALAVNETAVVSGGERYAFLDDGSLFSITVWSGVSDTVPDTLGTVCSSGQTITFSTGSYLTVTDTGSASGKFMLPPSTNIVYSASLKSVIYSFIFWDGFKYRIGFYKNSTEPYYTSYVDDLTPYFEFTSDASLSVSAPNGLAISDVEAVTPEQAYALTFEGVTATDVEGIVNEAVGRILDGTYSAVGEITDALDVPQDLTWQEHIAQIWENIKALPKTIAQAIASAFAPDVALVDEITTTFNSKFGWLETIHRFGQDLFGMTADTAPPVIYIHLEDAEGQYNYGGMEKALDMTWYQRYKADVDRILSGFMWLAFLWLVFKRASAIIQGGEMITEYTNDLDQGHR